MAAWRGHADIVRVLIGAGANTEYKLDVSCMMLAIVHPDMTSPRLVDVPRLDAESQAIHDFETEHGRADVSARMDTVFSI